MESHALRSCGTKSSAGGRETAPRRPLPVQAVRFGSGAMRQTGRHRHRRQQRLRNAADVQGAEFRRMSSRAALGARHQPQNQHTVAENAEQEPMSRVCIDPPARGSLCARCKHENSEWNRTHCARAAPNQALGAGKPHLDGLFRRMLSSGPGRKTSAAEPAYGGGKCGAGAAESAWQAEGAAAAAVRHWRELQARLWSIGACQIDWRLEKRLCGGKAWKLLNFGVLNVF